jgi:hypothetical protein
MCGIVGGICQNNITSLLVDGLKRLEYRGYDSAGLVILDNPTLQAGLSQHQDFRKIRAEKMARSLGGAGVVGAMGKTQALAKTDMLTRTHFAQMLIQEGVCKDRKHSLNLGLCHAITQRVCQYCYATSIMNPFNHFIKLCPFPWLEQPEN